MYFVTKEKIFLTGIKSTLVKSNGEGQHKKYFQEERKKIWNKKVDGNYGGVFEKEEDVFKSMFASKDYQCVYILPCGGGVRWAIVSVGQNQKTVFLQTDSLADT